MINKQKLIILEKLARVIEAVDTRNKIDAVREIRL